MLNTNVNESPATIEFKMTANRIKGSHPDGTKYDFLAFSGATKNGKKCKFKMTKTCNNVPKDEGTFTVTVEKTAINLDKSSIYTEYWVKDIVSVKPFEIVETALTDDDLPF